MNPCSRFLTHTLLALCFFTSLTVEHVAAQDMVLVKDINANPRALEILGRCTAGSTQFLIADDGFRGYELWVGDGIQGTTRLVKDINSGSDSAFSSASCAAIGNTLLFVADDGVHGTELWKTDGTTAGTVIVKDILSGSSGSSSFYLTELGGSVIFSANDGVNGNELWKSDGTEAGTVLVKDVYAGASSGSPSFFIKLNDTTIVFRGSDATSGNEIWKTDGTEIGTEIIKDIASGASSSNPFHMVRLGEKIFFSATTAATGREPWITDGTTSGTSALADIFAGATDGFYSGALDPAVVNGKAIFTGRNTTVGYEAFVSDGTTVGTTLLKDINTGSSNSFPDYYRAIGNRVVFSASTTAAGSELYTTDGTPSGTTLISDLNPGSGDGVSLYSSESALSGSPFMFPGGITESGATRAYATEGTTMTLLTDLFPGVTGQDIQFGAATDAGVTFGLPALVASIPGPGLFLTDGTPSGTIPHPGTLSGFTASSGVIPMAELNNKLIFTADDGVHGSELWSTDGTEGGTVRITDINLGIASSVLPQAGFAVSGGKLFFVASDAEHGAELWTSDGTTEGTALLKDIESGAGSAFYGSGSSSRRFFVVGSKVVFPATTVTHGTELWMSDGTTGGTSLISDIYPGTSSGVNDNLDAAVSESSFGPTLFFVADDGTRGSEVWATTTTVTGITSDIVTGASGSSPNDITAIPFGSGYFGVVFRACPTSTGCELCLTVGGAPSVIDAVPGASGANPSQFTFVSPSRLFFRAESSAEGTELWKSDTPFNSASIVKDVISGSGDFEISGLAKLDSSTIVFNGCGVATGLNCELWKSDGTSGGTTIVKDINSGSSSSGPEGFVVLNGVAYFLARDGAVGFDGKFFRTDGTEAGTTALTTQGFSYFTTTTLPAPFTPATSTLFFGGFSSAYGYELFKIGEDLCSSDPVKTAPGLCGCGAVDGDDDGDGAVDCLEACPTDPLKQSAGSCGCGALETDANANGAADCLDTEVGTLKPTKPTLRILKKRLRIKMTARTGVSYKVFYRTQRTGTSLAKKAKFKSVTVDSATTSIKAPRRGYTTFVKYRYLVTVSDIVSSTSSVARKARG